MAIVRRYKNYDINPDKINDIAQLKYIYNNDTATAKAHNVQCVWRYDDGRTLPKSTEDGKYS